MKRKFAALCLLFVFFCSSCGLVGFDTQNLMRPPKPTGEKSEIQKAFEEQAGGQVTLRYPQRGDYRSAIVLDDLDSNGTEEAIFFYRPDGENMGVHLMVLSKVDDHWTALQDFTVQESEVDRVLFGDLDGNGIKEIIVGWSVYTGTVNRLEAYAFDGDRTVSRISGEEMYSEIFLYDFDQNRVQEILTVALSSASTVGNTEAVPEAKARLLSLNREGNALRVKGSANLDATVTRYASTLLGVISPGQMGLILDGIRSGNVYVSEIVYWDPVRQTLCAPFYSEDPNLANVTQRAVAVTAKDIDGDGTVEFPVVSRLPGYADAAVEAASYLIGWNKYDPQTNTLVYKLSMVPNNTDGYQFIMPDEWRTRVTAKREAGIITFYEWITDEEGVGAMGISLLKIGVFTQDEWQDQKISKDYFCLREQKDKIYAACLPHEENSLSLTRQGVMERFLPIDSN